MASAHSFCRALAICGSSPVAGQPTILACLGGGSWDLTSKEALRTCPALNAAIPCKVRSPATYTFPISHNASHGSAACRNTDVSPFFGLGKNAAGLTIDVLNRLDEVRNLTSVSSSSICSGRPDGSAAKFDDPVDSFKNAKRNISTFETRHSMPLIRPVEPRVRQPVACANTQ